MQKGTKHTSAARSQIAASQRERLRRLRFAEAAFEARLLLYADDPERDECLRLARRAHEGIIVDEVTVDRSRSDVEGLGVVRSRFADDDTRSVSDKAEAGARMALAGMLVESKADPRASDGDVRSAYELAAIAGAPDQSEWVHQRSDEVQSMIRADIFRRILDGLSYALLAETTLSHERIGDVVRAIPGAPPPVSDRRKDPAVQASSRLLS